MKPLPEVNQQDLYAAIDVIQVLQECATRTALEAAIGELLIPLLNVDCFGCSWMDFDIPTENVKIDKTFLAVNVDEREHKAFEALSSYHRTIHHLLATNPLPVLATGVDLPADDFVLNRARFVADNPDFPIEKHTRFSQVHSQIVIANPPDFTLASAFCRTNPDTGTFIPRDVHLASLLQPSLVAALKSLAIQEALSSTEALVGALTSVPEPICVVNANRRVQFSNASARQLLGLAEGQPLTAEIAAGLSSRGAINHSLTIEIAQFNKRRHHAAGATTYRVEQIPIYLQHVDLELLKFIPVDPGLVAAIARMQACHLTAKEIEVALFIRSGLARKAIARQLFISVNTVKAHLKNIHAKLGTGSRAELVATLNAHAMQAG